MIIVGLTGSIAMGKSTAAAVFRHLGVPVYDADRAVHRLLARGGRAVAPIAAQFPAAIKDGTVDRNALAAHVFADDAALKALERIVHPLVRETQRGFLRRQAARRTPLVVLDIPLLLESPGATRCDFVVVVSAPRFLQLQRALARTGMTRERLAGILARQMPDREKRRRADFVVDTGLGKRHSLRRLVHIVKLVRRRRGRSWPPRPRFRRLHA